MTSETGVSCEGGGVGGLRRARWFPDLIDLGEVLANSYRDFHVKGFDYLCLKRSEAETIKVYFFDGDVSKAPEVVIPHDHRYGFRTDVVAGSMVNRKFVVGGRCDPDAKPYERFDYLTPLNGGPGFTWRETAWLRAYTETEYQVGENYSMGANGIHTIQITGPETIICLRQYADLIPVGKPTSAYRPDGMREPPSLDGLYRPMDADHALRRIATLRDLLGEAA